MWVGGWVLLQSSGDCGLAENKVFEDRTMSKQEIEVVMALSLEIRKNSHSEMNFGR